MKNTNTKNGKKGRKLGSFNFSMIPLSELTGKLNPTSNVIVSTSFLKTLGITTAQTGEATQLHSLINPVSTPPAQVVSQVTAQPVVS